MRTTLHRRIVLLAAATAGALALAELALRLLAPQPVTWLEIYRRHPRLPFHANQAGLDVRIDTGETKWRVLTDAAGLRIGAGTRALTTAGAERATPTPQRDAPQPAEPAAPAILVLGDSFTFGNGVDHEQSFVGLLAHDSLPVRRVENAGVGAYGPVQYRRLLEDRLQRGPPPALVVVVSYLGNDFQDCMFDKDLPVRDGALADGGGMRRVISKNLHLYRLAARIWRAVAPPPELDAAQDLFRAAAWEEPFWCEARQRWQDEFARMAELCAAASMPLLVCTIPPRECVAGANGAGGDEHAQRPPCGPAHAALAALGVRWVDTTVALAEIGAPAAYFAHDGHLTPAGHRVVHAALAPLVRESIEGRALPQRGR